MSPLDKCFKILDRWERDYGSLLSVAEKLGMSKETLYRWKRDHKIRRNYQYLISEWDNDLQLGDDPKLKIFSVEEALDFLGQWRKKEKSWDAICVRLKIKRNTLMRWMRGNDKKIAKEYLRTLFYYSEQHPEIGSFNHG